MKYWQSPRLVEIELCAKCAFLRHRVSLSDYVSIREMIQDQFQKRPRLRASFSLQEVFAPLVFLRLVSRWLLVYVAVYNINEIHFLHE